MAGVHNHLSHDFGNDTSCRLAQNGRGLAETPLTGRVSVAFGSLVQSLYQAIDQALWCRPLTHGSPSRLSDPVNMPVRRVTASNEPLVVGDIGTLQRIEGARYVHLVQASAFSDVIYGNEVVAGLVEHAYNRLKDRKVAA